MYIHIYIYDAFLSCKVRSVQLAVLVAPNVEHQAVGVELLLGGRCHIELEVWGILGVLNQGGGRPRNIEALLDWNPSIRNAPQLYAVSLSCIHTVYQHM